MFLILFTGLFTYHWLKVNINYVTPAQGHSPHLAETLGAWHSGVSGWSLSVC